MSINEAAGATGREHRLVNAVAPTAGMDMKRWDGGTMALRWCAAWLLEAKKQFRRVNGHLHLKAFRVALDKHVEKGVTTPNFAAREEVAA